MTFDLPPGSESSAGGFRAESEISDRQSPFGEGVPSWDSYRPIRIRAPTAWGTAGPSRTRATGAEVDPRDVTVLLATINERESLPTVLAEIEAAVGPGVQLMIVDDGSSDGTREYLLDSARSDGSLRWIFNPGPQTIVGAHIQGIANSRTPYIVVMDSDGQHPPSAIPKLLQALHRGADVAVGTRFGPGGSTGGRTPFRGLVSRVAAILIQVTIRNTRRISDPTSGFFAVRRASLVPFTRDLRGYETLVFVLAMMKAPRIAEVPYVFRERKNGESKVLRGFSFFRVFFTQLVAAKRTEFDARARIGPPAAAASAKPRPRSEIGSQG